MVQPPATRPCPPSTPVLMLHSATPMWIWGRWLALGSPVLLTNRTDGGIIIFTPVFLLITPITQILPLRFLPVILPANIMVLPNLVWKCAVWAILAGFKYVSSVTVAKGDRKTFPIYIDLGPVNTTSLNVRGVFTVELKLGGKTATFKYQPIYDDPTIE